MNKHSNLMEVKIDELYSPLRTWH